MSCMSDGSAMSVDVCGAVEYVRQLLEEKITKCRPKNACHHCEA